MDDETSVPGSWGAVFQTLANGGRGVGRTFGWALIALGIGCAAGCRSSKPIPLETVPNAWFGRASIAVAPAVNLSGSRDFDPNRVADLMAVELGYVQGIRVIPVSRILGVLAAQGMEGIASPAHAAEVAQWVGADAILVFAITEYDPYDPPRVGMTAQLFGALPHETTPAAGSGPQNGQAQESPSGKPPSVPVLAEAQRVFDASHAGVVSEIQEFAKRRSADDSPYGWRKYVVTQEGFVEFCCHQTVAALARQPAVTTAMVVQEK